MTARRPESVESQPPEPPAEGPTLAQSQRIVSGLLELSCASGEIDDIIRLLTLLACAVTGKDGAAVELVDGPDMRYAAGAGLLAGTEGLRIPREGSLSGLAVATTRPEVCSDIEGDTRVNRAMCEQLGFASLAVLPIRHEHHTFGSLKVVGATAGQISEFDVTLLEPLVKVAAVRMAQITTSETTRERLNLLGDATELSKAVLLAEDPGQCLVDAVLQVTGAALATLTQPEGDELVVTHVAGGTMPILRISADEPSLVAGAFRSGKPRLVSDWATQADASPVAAAAFRAAGLDRHRSVAYIPLETPEGPVGVLGVILAEPLTASNLDVLGMLQLLAAEAGIAITRDGLRRRLADQARTDPLTGLPNRRVWQERIELEVVRATRNSSPLAVMMLDLDHFKVYNDTYGHPAGDALLTGAAEAWAAVLRPTDLLARLGGEEFAVLLSDTDLDAAQAIAARLGSVVPGDETVSIGLTLFASGEALAKTMQRVDEALYDAKAAGRDCYRTR